PQIIRWGEASTDEMGSVFVVMIPEEEKQARALTELVATERKRAIVGVLTNGQLPETEEKIVAPSAAEIIKTFDADASGALSFDEFPDGPFQDRLVKMDSNGDLQLDKEELSAMVKRINLALKYGFTGDQASWVMKRLLKKQLGVN
ncbi:MAG: hypothetical protein AAF226_04200, partial [Verrucomicrobiota bacterium]